MNMNSDFVPIIREAQEQQKACDLLAVAQK